MKHSSYNQKRLGFRYCKMLLAVLVYSGGAIVPTDWQQAYAGAAPVAVGSGRPNASVAPTRPGARPAAPTLPVGNLPITRPTVGVGGIPSAPAPVTAPPTTVGSRPPNASTAPASCVNYWSAPVGFFGRSQLEYYQCYTSGPAGSCPTLYARFPKPANICSCAMKSYYRAAESDQEYSCKATCQQRWGGNAGELDRCYKGCERIANDKIKRNEDHCNRNPNEAG